MGGVSLGALSEVGAERTNQRCKPRVTLDKARANQPLVGEIFCLNLEINE